MCVCVALNCVYVHGATELGLGDDIVVNSALRWHGAQGMVATAIGIFQTWSLHFHSGEKKIILECRHNVSNSGGYPSFM